MKPANQQPSPMPPPGLKHPGRWVWWFLLVPVVLGLVRLRFDVEVFDLLPANLPVVEGLKLYQDHFANARELILTVQTSNAEQTETVSRTLAQSLRQQPSLAASATWEPPWLEHPEQAAELMAYLWFNQPPAVFAQLTNRLAPDKLAEVLNTTREQLTTSLSPEDIARLSYDPFGLTRLPESVAGATPAFSQGQETFSSQDGTFRILFVQAPHELRTYRDCDRWVTAVKQSVNGTLAGLGPASRGVAIGYTGRPAFMAEIALGMQHDMTTSVGGTTVIIAILFWLAHRRLKPMLWLLALLAVILGCTLALGGLIFGTINVVSMGFAAILLGLAVDYAVVHYQEALAQPHLSIPQIRHAIAPSIFWAAVTTVAAFLVLNFGGLPGLGQLGTLVGLGVTLAALIMIFEFLPPLFPGRNKASAQPLPAGPVDVPISAPPNRLRTAVALAVTALVLVFTIAVLLFGLPPIDPTANALRPRRSPAYAAVDQIQAHLNQKREPLWLIVSGRTETEVAQRLEEVQRVLARAVSNQLIAGFTLPTPLWPRPEFQDLNRPTARHLVAERDLLRQAAHTNGFAPSALGLTERMLDAWQQMSATAGTFWPTNPMSRWIFEKLAARTITNNFSLGLLNAATNGPTASHSRLVTLESHLPRQGVWLSGWELLGSAILSRVKANMWKVVAPMVILVLLSLWLAFRRAPEMLLSLAVLLLSGLCLLTVMRLAHWSWNLLNLMAVPLVLGTGVDYSIFMQLALRRHHGDLAMAYRSVGRALLLCGGTAIAGFGSLAWSSNAGMASLGQVCAVGIGSNMLIAIFLLPIWWEKVLGAPVRTPLAAFQGSGNSPPAASGPRVSGPSSLYRPGLWRLGLRLVRWLPANVCAALGRLLVSVYWLVAGHRREVVIQNLLPALNGDRAAAVKKAKALFRQFARKLIDLWRYEAGLPLDDLFGPSSGWEHLTEAQAQKRGVLLLTPHLGNWELGGPWMTRHGQALQVLTLAEPGEKFTEIRQTSRARWKVETLVIGNDPLAFVEIIRRLESGGIVALLVDRPPPPTAITVELFGRPFHASVAAAELARASGCVLLPVHVLRTGSAYEAHMLPPIAYDRAALRDRQARQQLTQQILRTFEPLIRQHLDQWYHFVPVWPQTSASNTPPGLPSQERPGRFTKETR